MEINGFEIDKFNIHGLKEGDDQSICPLCSHERKKSKDKCASLDWKRGLGTCHHCGEVFQLHSFKRKTDKQYVRPKPNEGTSIDPRVVNYFNTRGISLGTLNRAKITTRPGWIEFNYYINNELVNVKSRDARKNFRLTKGAERVLYNIDSTLGHDYIVIVEGEIDALSVMEAGIPSVVSV
ncbi:MAG: toprim domain-containing protein, partial [Pirellulales bacterium]|nr:toprim domain-containing protein [Pirellulales bacterium]